MKARVLRFWSGAIAVLLLAVMCVPAFASTGSQYEQKTIKFWDWAVRHPIVKEIFGYSSGTVCAKSEDGYHHANSYQEDRGDGYFNCICSHCGQKFTAYESDLKQSYDNQVAELPATGITSAGKLLWYPTISDVWCFGYDIGTLVFYGHDATSKTCSSDHLVELSLNKSTVVYKNATYSLTDKRSLHMSVSDSSKLFQSGASSPFEFGFIPPVVGYYKRVASPMLIKTSVTYTGQSYTECVDYSVYVHDQIINTSGSMRIPVSDMGVTLSGGTVVYYLFSFDFFFPIYEITPLVLPDSEPGGQYSITTRPTTITGGNYGIVGDDGQITTITDNSTIVNETTNNFYNPATGQNVPILDWSYDYGDRTYTVTLEDGDTVNVTYGDENIIIKEGDTVYNIYYMVDGTGGDNPDPSPSPDPDASASVCPHVWVETSRTEPTCTAPGKAEYICSSCGETKTETLKALGHTWQVLRTVQTAYDEEGNLVQQGYTIYQCAVCGEQYKDDQGTGPPGGSSGDEDDGESIFDKIGNLIGGLFKGIIDIINTVLSKILDGLIVLSEMLMDKLNAVVEVVLTIFDEVPKLFGGFLDFLSIIFPYLPSEITLLLTFGVVAVVFIAIIKALRG